MAIEITRICDLCGSRHKQHPETVEQYVASVKTYLLAFTCSDCLLKKEAAESSSKDMTNNPPCSLG